MSNETRGRAPLSLCAVTRTVHTVWGRGTLLKALVHLYIRCFTRALRFSYIAPGVGSALCRLGVLRLYPSSVFPGSDTTASLEHNL